jgi:GAF domain-containing protein
MRRSFADAVVSSLGEAAVRISSWLGASTHESFLQAIVPAADAERVAAVRASGALDTRAQPLLDAVSQRAADIFDVPMAMVTWIDETTQQVRGRHGSLTAGAMSNDEGLSLPREMTLCGHVVANAQTLVVPDIAKDLRFAGNPIVQARGIRFYAGAPLRNADGYILGTLCLLDEAPRALTQREVKLLESMATELMDSLRAAVREWGDMTAVVEPVETPSATLGQAIPAS